MFTEGCSDLDWAKRLFMASDVSKRMKWADFVKKGYYVVPPEPEAIRTPRNYGWFAEGRHKDAPSRSRCPRNGRVTSCKGLPTQSGKIEFIPNSLKRFDAVDPERSPLNRYVPSWEGPRTEALVKKFPVQMISTHSRYSFHTYGDGKDSTINDIRDHRVNVGGYDYWVMRINDEDAKARGIKQDDLIRVFNDRGSVVCAADVSPLTMRGVCKTYELSAESDFRHDPRYGLVDFGGCVNILTPDRPQTRNTDGMGSNACLVQFETWMEPEPALLRA